MYLKRVRVLTETNDSRQNRTGWTGAVKNIFLRDGTQNSNETGLLHPWFELNSTSYKGTNHVISKN